MKLSKKASRLTGQPMFQLKEKTVGKKDLIHLEIGDTYFDTSPDIIEATVRSLLSGDTHYTNPQGLDELRKELGIRTLTSPDNICVLPANAIIDYTIRCLCDEDDEVLIQDPSFPTYKSVLDYLGIKTVKIPTYEKNKWHIDLNDIEKRVSDKTKLLIINSPCNPTGAVLPFDVVKGIYDLAEKYDFYILSDEVYSQLTYDLLIHWSFGDIDRDYKRTVVLRSFSKEYAMTGYRMGFLITNKKLAKKMALLTETIYSCMPVFLQKGAIEALDSNITEYKDYYNNNRILFSKGIENIPKLNCRMPEGAFYAFVNIKDTGMSSCEFQDYMINKGVVLLSGSYFGKQGEGYVRICLANKSEDIQEALKRLERALK